MNENLDLPEVEPGDAHQRMLGGSGVILDVREQDEVKQASITGSLHIPLTEFNQRLGEIPREQDLFVICHVGQRSATVTEYLRELGHERVWNIRGGIIAWARAGLPVEAIPGGR